VPVAPRRIRNFCAPLVGAALAFALATASVPARADEYDAAFTRAIAAKEKALDSNDPASWESALELFSAADRIRSTKESKYELGNAAARLRQDDLAVEAFAAALALGVTGTAAEKARDFLNEKQKDMGRLTVHGPDGAEIHVAERRRGTLPLPRPLVLFAGKRTLRVTLGDESITRQVEVAAGSTSTLELGTSLSAPGGTAPAPVASAPPTADTGSPPPPPPPDRTAPWVLTLGGAGLAIAGTVTVIAASSSLSSHRSTLGDLCAVKSGDDDCLEAKPGQRATAQNEVDSIATQKGVRTGGWVSLGVGALSAGIGVVWLLGPSGGSSQTGLYLVPEPGGARLAIGGRL
jgi:hypothetical protein